MSSETNALGPAVVEAIDVHHHYGDGAQRVDVLFDINMQVREGELVIVTGPSGSGKTTLLTILGTMRRPSEGKLKLLGTNVSDISNAELDKLRNRVRFLFQKRNLLSSLTALQNVIAGVSTTALANPDWDEVRARHLLGLLGLGDKAASWPDELSGGQQQRVAIARVMIGLPDLIIADEPTSALDRVAGRLVVDQLKDLAMRAKCAVVLSTHDERIFDVASRRLHIEDGRCFEVPIHYH
ncbi:MAG: ATP-binding cassette domain-containing protein [Proteobacteria bacterium]|nr:ATP-binding cassette domain-containing protein [Pseudomonadota bacterium]